MRRDALFPAVLGDAFERLDAPVRAVHGGESRAWQGWASVERGRSSLARLLAALASLPRSAGRAPLTVRIEAQEAQERWTRHFGEASAMTSTLAAREGRLVERLGAARLSFRLEMRAGGIDWHLERITAWGCPLPRACFVVSARSASRGSRYRFTVDAGLRGVGRIVRYEGELDVGA